MHCQCGEQQNIMAEMLQEIQEKDEKLMCFQEKEERLQQLEKELSELLPNLAGYRRTDASGRKDRPERTGLSAMAGIGTEIKQRESLIAETEQRIVKQIENRSQIGNIQALKNDLRKTKELCRARKRKRTAAEAMIEECQDKQGRQNRNRDYALSHQKKSRRYRLKSRYSIKSAGIVTRQLI